MMQISSGRSDIRLAYVRSLMVALCFLSAAPAQGDRDFLRAAFAEDSGPLLSSDTPHLSLLLGNRPVTVKERHGGDAILVAPASEVTLQAQISRQGPFQFCRIRPAPGSFLAPEELKLA